MSDDEKDLFGSDSESDEQPARKANAADDANLDDDMEDDDVGEKPRSKSQKRGRLGSDDEDDNGRDGRRAREENEDPHAPPVSPGYSDEEEDGEGEGRPQSQTTHLFKASTMVGIQQTPFNPDTFQADEEMIIDEHGHMSRRPAHQEQIRWRFKRDADGNEIKESNARFVRWSDGSLQLLLGDEVLDVKDQDISANNYYLYYAVKNILQGQTQLNSRLAVRPASLDSKIHRRMRDAVDKRHAKVHRVGRFGGILNAEEDKAKKEALIDEKIRGSENYLEEEQDWEDDGYGPDGYDDDGMTATERARSGLNRPRHMDEEEEEEEEYASTGEAVMTFGRGLLSHDDDDVEDEEEEEYASTGARKVAKEIKDNKMKARRGVVLSDDED
eukprot:gene11246-18871_t